MAKTKCSKCRKSSVNEPGTMCEKCAREERLLEEASHAAFDIAEVEEENLASQPGAVRPDDIELVGLDEPDEVDQIIDGHPKMIKLDRKIRRAEERGASSDELAELERERDELHDELLKQV